MNIQNTNSREHIEDITEQSVEVATPGVIETGVNSVGLALVTGGFALSLVKPEIGYVMMGTGLGLVVGGLAVGYAIRHGDS